MKPSAAPFRRATLAMIGTIIGAGVFAIPFAMKTLGIFAGSVVYWILALAVVATHLLFVEVIFAVPKKEKHRLPGIADAILGPWAKWLAILSHPLNIIGACLAYLILGGEFLARLAQAAGLPSSVFSWQIAFWVGGAVSVFLGLAFVSKVEAWMTWALIGLLFLSVFLFFPHAVPSLFSGAVWGNAFLPLGIYLFALTAFPVIPEIVDLCGRDPKKARTAVLVGSISAAAIMWLFSVFAYAAVGPSLSSDPSDVARGLPTLFFWLLPAVGFFAVATSFITIMQDLKAMLHLDLKLPKPIAWAIALGAPLFLLLVTRRNFLDTVGFVGSIFGALNGLLITMMALAIFTNGKQKTSKTGWIIVAVLSSVVFSLAFIWRIVSR